MSAPWAVHGTDLSFEVVDRAKSGLYPLDRCTNIPPEYLRRYCLKGEGRYSGSLLVSRELRARTQFRHANLMRPLPDDLPQFDVIFLRNVLIYFDNRARTEMIERVSRKLKPDGILYIGHAESLNGLDVNLRRSEEHTLNSSHSQQSRMPSSA